ncbi:MAG: outer membrane beta-barrel protein [Limisphaerales bacterium]
MKRIVVSVGLVALGTSGLQADSLSSLTSESTKPWSVSATLRGFYDDNINTAPGSGPLIYNGQYYHRSTFGFEVSPAFTVSWPWEQTTVTAGYTYSFKDYQFVPVGNTDTVDMTHSFNLALDHTFNELYRARVSDSFVIGQEPDFLRAGNTYSTYQRLSGSNIRNYGTATLNGTLTPLLGFEIGYQNALYRYSQDTVTPDPAFSPSWAGILNRIEQTVHLDSRWTITPETVGVIGYQFADIDYTEDQPIMDPALFNVPSNTRNNRGHYGYAGIDETFRPDLTGSLRVGARYTDYYNDPAVSGSVSPYVALSLRYIYDVESFAELGFTHDRAASSLWGSGGLAGLTLDSDTTVVYGTVSHRLAPGLYGSLIGQYQDSEYHGGQYNSEADRFYTLGANLEYRVNHYVSTQVGYNYDKLESDIADRGFDRNRVYVGFTASY